MAKPPSIKVMRGGGAVAEISTGPRNANGFYQPAGEKQQHRQLGYVEGRRPCHPNQAQALRHRKADAQRDVEPGGERDHRETGPDRQLVVEARNTPPARRWSGQSPPAAAAEPAYRGARCARSDGLPWRLVGHGATLSPSQGASKPLAVAPFVLGRPPASARRSNALASRYWPAPCRPRDHDAMTQTAEPAIAVDQLVKVYKTTRAVDGISFALEPKLHHRAARRNGAGKTTTIAMIIGLVTPTSGAVNVLGAEIPRQRYQVLHTMNFESPYIDMPHRLTGCRQNLKVFGRLYAVDDLNGRIAALARTNSTLNEFLDRPTGKLWPDRNAGRAREGAHQLPTGPSARRADRVARSRHRRLGARPSRTLSRGAPAPRCCSPPTT